MDKFEALKKYFNYDSFRKGQEDIIDSIINKNATLAILPTGGGKSVCFQIPGLVLEGLTIVISPLISLMSDQVKHLREKLINARYLNSSLSFREQNEIIDEISSETLKFLYVSPERFKNKRFLDVIKNVKVSQIVLDEAHSISLYGHDFRPDYYQIGEFIDIFKDKPVISAFTATASQSVISDIKNVCKINFKVFKYGFDRSNLFYQTIETKNKFDELTNLLNNNLGKTTIIYTLTRRTCEELYYRLKKKNYNVGIYHGGLDDEAKSYYQDLFMQSKIDIMCATSAFGTGIDKENVRMVVIYSIPMSLEDLSQEFGRAGRDNLPSLCTLIFNMSDLRDNDFFISSIDDLNISDEAKKTLKKVKREKLREVVGFVTTKRCLHEYLVSHFGELFMSYCNNCSNCMKYTKTHDYLKEAKLIIDTVKLTKERYGSQIISKIISGSKEKTIKEKHLSNLKTYNKTFHSINDVKNVISNLVNDGYLEKTYDEYPILKLNEQSDLVYELEDYKLRD